MKMFTILPWKIFAFDRREFFFSQCTQKFITLLQFAISSVIIYECLF